MARLETEDTAVRGGDPDGATTVGADGDRDESGGNTVGRASGTAACIEVPVEGVARSAPVWIVVGRVETDLVHVGFADNECTGVDEALDTPGGGAGIGGIGAAAGGFREGQADSFRCAGDGELVFDEDGDAGEGRVGGGGGGGGRGIRGCDGEDSACSMDGRRGQEDGKLVSYCSGGGGEGGVSGGVRLAGVERRSSGAGGRRRRHGGTVGDDGRVEAGSVGVEDPRGLEGSKGAEVGVAPEDVLEGPNVGNAGARYQ